MFNKLYEKIKKFIKNNIFFLIFMVLLIVSLYWELPYIIYKSGGTIDLRDRIEVAKEYKMDGDLQMSYVTAMKGTPAFILLSFILPDWDLIPLNDITNEESYNEVLEQGKVYLNEGIDNAIIAAFRETDYELTITREINAISVISEKAKTDVKIGDEVISIDDIIINNLDNVKNYINTLSDGTVVSVKVRRDDKELDKMATVYYEEADDSLKIGIAFNKHYEYETEIPVKIKMKKNESGSSGGLMMSLAIYNALTDEDITHGLNIVGTGSINSDGTVEEIGGVKYKVLGAVKDKADIFLCPVENYEEALEIKEKRNLNIEIKAVSNLKEAIEYLESLSLRK